MKRLFTLLFMAVILCAAVASCNNGSQGPDDSATPVDTTHTPKDTNAVALIVQPIK